MMPYPGFCYQSPIKELIGYRIVEAELQKNILQIVTAKAGKVHRWVFKFDEKYSTYKVTQIDLTSSAFHGINFAVLEKGVVVEQYGDNDLRLYSTKFEADADKVVQNTGVYTLYAEGNTLMGVVKTDVYELSLTGK